MEKQLLYMMQQAKEAINYLNLANELLKKQKEQEAQVKELIDTNE